MKYQIREVQTGPDEVVYQVWRKANWGCPWVREATHQTRLRAVQHMKDAAVYPHRLRTWDYDRNGRDVTYHGV